MREWFRRTDDVAAPKRDEPDTVSAAVGAMQAELTIVRDLWNGYRALRAKSTTYLPQHPGEEAYDYRIRLNRPAFFNAFARSVRGLTGFAFRKDPVLGENVPPIIAEHWKDIDRVGTDGAVFLKQAFQDVLIAGHGCILVDAPPAPEGLTLAQERELELRPFWVYIRPDDIVSFRATVDNGVTRLEQIVFRETIEEQTGEFLTEPKTRYRIYRRVIDPESGPIITWELQEKVDKVWATVEKGIVRNVDTIPVAPVYANRTGLWTSTPPLIDLAYANLLHYQTSSDLLHAQHIACVPILFGRGIKTEELTVGPNSAVIVEETEGAELKWVETSGNAIGQTRELLKDIEGQLAVLGLEMLRREARIQETAEAKRLDRSEQDSQLASCVRSLRDAVETALKFHAQMLQLPTGGSIVVNTDFQARTLDAAMLEQYRLAVTEGRISLDTLWSIMEEYGALPADFDPELERKKLVGQSTEVTE